MSNACKKWKEEHNIQRLPCPTNSLDLSPIENIWEIMKMEISEEGPTTLEQCFKIIRYVWNKLDPNLARKLVDSMYDRIDECRMNNGNCILY